MGAGNNRFDNIRFVAVARRDDQKQMLASLLLVTGDPSPQKVWLCHELQPHICFSLISRVNGTATSARVAFCVAFSTRPWRKKSSDRIKLRSTRD
jgi:hypothetical protein